MTADDFTDDVGAAEMFGISIVTLRHHMMESFVCPAHSVDIRKAFPVKIGRKRRWIRQNIVNLINCPNH